MAIPDPDVLVEFDEAYRKWQRLKEIRATTPFPPFQQGVSAKEVEAAGLKARAAQEKFWAWFWGLNDYRREWWIDHWRLDRDKLPEKPGVVDVTGGA